LGPLQRLFMGATAKAQIFDSEFSGHDFIRIELDKPYNEILLRRRGAKRRSSSIPVVTCAQTADPGTWPKELTLAWDGLGDLQSYADTPAKVLEAWVNKFRFRTGDKRSGSPGLRTPQVGALHAISAHFAVGQAFDPATVVLPTGTGKTETMLATQVYRENRRLSGVMATMFWALLKGRACAALLQIRSGALQPPIAFDVVGNGREMDLQSCLDKPDRKRSISFWPGGPSRGRQGLSLGLAFAGSSSISVRLIYSTHFLKAPRLE
jgi:hypothetical protein